MRALTAATTEDYCCQSGSAQYYALCALGGALSCGLTHTALTPVDLLKCRIQVQTTLQTPDTRQGPLIGSDQIRSVTLLLVDGFMIQQSKTDA